MKEKITSALREGKLVLWNNGKDQFLIVEGVKGETAFFKNNSKITADLTHVIESEFIITTNDEGTLHPNQLPTDIMWRYKFEDFIFTQENGELKREVKKATGEDLTVLDIRLAELTSEAKEEIKEKAIAFIKGKEKYFRVWSDYNPDEACTIVYLSVIDGKLEPKLIDDMETLVRKINTPCCRIYQLIIEDGLL